MPKLLSFLGLLLTSFAPVMLIQIVATKNFGLAADLSKFFAIGTVVYAFLYMGQRQYINIYGPVCTERGDFLFRLFNMVLASSIVYLFLTIEGADVNVFFLVAGFKLSEATVDFLFGHYNFKYGFESGSYKYFQASIFRVIILLSVSLIFWYFNPLAIEDVLLDSSSYLFLFSLAALFSILFLFEGSLLDLDYKKVLLKMLPFSVSASICSLVLLLPRWIVPESSQGVDEFLVAFSIVPVFGVALNTLFASNISLAKTNIKKAFLKMLLITSGLLLLVIISFDVQMIIISYFYGLDDNSSSHFAESIFFGCLLYSSILFANFFKFKNVLYESYCYIAGILTMSIILYFSGDINLSIFISSVAMLLFSTISLKGDNERNYIS